jgi:hypothetical protein
MSEDPYGTGTEPMVADVYAFRTFQVLDGRLASIGAGVLDDNNGGWNNGMCEAYCRTNPEHQAPVRDCHCGVYGFYAIDHLLTQYPDQAVRIIAVITIRGRVLVDDKGLRATAARVVAYWCAEDAVVEAAVCANDCPGARRFYDRDVMTRICELTGQPPV